MSYKLFFLKEFFIAIVSIPPTRYADYTAKPRDQSAKQTALLEEQLKTLKSIRSGQLQQELNTRP